eukprot:symbB.v1.2.012432.t1/scaffold860.1/size157271/1
MGNGTLIHGMLGMEFFEKFAVDLGTEIRLYQADDGDKVAKMEDMECLTTAPLPARLLGVLLCVPGNDACVKGVLDTGASFSVLNWAAAEVLLHAVKADKDVMLRERGGVTSLDAYGHALLMPTLEAQFELRGAGQDPPGTWTPDPIEAGELFFFVLAMTLLPRN